MLCGCIMLAWSGQATCCVAAPDDRWHYGPQWGGKGMPMVRVNCKDRCNFSVTVCITLPFSAELDHVVFTELLLVVCVMLHHEITPCATDVFFCVRMCWIVALSLGILHCLSCGSGFVCDQWHWLSWNCSFDSPAAFWELCFLNYVILDTGWIKLLVKGTFCCLTFLSFGSFIWLAS